MRYVLCLVCGKLTPNDKGVCYHCGSRLPAGRIVLAPGRVVCPVCLRVTPSRLGRCVHCGAPLKGLKGIIPWLDVEVEGGEEVAGLRLEPGG